MWKYWNRKFDIPLPTAMLKRRLSLKSRYQDYKLVAGPTSLSLIVTLLSSLKPSHQWIEDCAKELEEYLNSEGITQATTLFACAPSQVVETNPLLFENSEEYSVHYGAIPFEVGYP